MIDTLLAVGFAAATMAAVSSDDDPEAETSAVSTLGVGTATTAAFIASAAHGHNSIQNCLAAQHRVPSIKGGSKGDTKVASSGSAVPVLPAQATFAASVTAP